MLINSHSIQETTFRQSHLKKTIPNASFEKVFDVNKLSENIPSSMLDSIQKSNDSLNTFYQTETREQFIQNLINGKITLDEYVKIESEKARDIVDSKTFQDIQIQYLAFAEYLKQQGIGENEIGQLNPEEFQTLKESFFELITAFEIMQETQKDFERKIVFDTDDFILQLLATNQVPQLKLSNQANLESFDTENFLAHYFNQALDDLTLLDRADAVLQKIKPQKNLENTTHPKQKTLTQKVKNAGATLDFIAQRYDSIL